MARISGRNCFIAACTAGATASLNLSGRANTFTLTLTSEEVDVTSFGALYRERVADALRDWSLECSGFWDGAANQIDAFLYSIYAACCSVRVGPGGSTSGCTMYSGCMILQEYSVEGAVEGTVNWSATFQAASIMNVGTMP